MLSSEILLHVAYQRISSIFRATRIGNRGRTLAVTIKRTTLLRNTVTLKMEAISASETPVFTSDARHNIPENGIR
jgi:hypothetical protein